MMNSSDSCRNSQFLRSAYRPDMIQALQASHDYSGTITQSSGNHKCINNAIHITSVDDKTRAEALAYFNSCQQSAAEAQLHHNKEKNRGIAATIVGVSAGVGGIGLAAAFVAPPVAAAIGICGLATTIFGARKIARNQEIIKHLEQDWSNFQSQRELWRDPVHQAIEQRRLAGSQGFGYVFNNNLKHTIIHPEEAKALWVRDFVQLLSRPASISAFSADLLGKAKLDYAWNGAPFHDLEVGNRILSAALLQGMAVRYQECSREYQHFQARINEEIRSLDHQYQVIKQGIENQREAWLQPAYHIRDMGIQEANMLYNQAINQFIRERDLAISEVERDCNFALRECVDMNDRAQIQSIRNTMIASIRRDYDHHPEVIAIEEAYRRDRLMCSFLFDQSKSTVDAFFDQRLHQLDREATHARQQIDQQRVNGEGYFAHHLNQILQGSEANINCLHVSPPMMMRQWALASNYTMEPSWNEVYGRRPRFQTTFATTLTEDAWNLFWGDRGLRRFASSPIHSWKSFASDRSYFPFQQRGFHLHSIRHTPRQRMFCQRVVIPTMRTTRVVPGTRTATASAGRQQCEAAQPPRAETVRATPGTSSSSSRRRETPVTAPKAPPRAATASREERTRAIPGAGLSGTRRREEVAKPVRDSVKSNPGAGLGGTRRREETPLRTEAVRAASGDNGSNTQRREEASSVRREAVRAKPGTGFGGTKRR